MAALLVGISVMAILLSIALPTWSHLVRREKEEELIFRGNQYARAINAYQRKFANASPPSLDVLIEQRLLRKKYTDPLSPNKDGEFQMLYFLTSQGPGSAGRGAGAPAGLIGSIGPSQTTTGPIVGVVSKNPGSSIKVYKGKQKYNEWQFIGMELSNQAGPGAGGAGRAGAQRGGRRGQDSMRGGRGSTPGGLGSTPGGRGDSMFPPAGGPFQSPSRQGR